MLREVIPISYDITNGDNDLIDSRIVNVDIHVCYIASVHVP